LYKKTIGIKRNESLLIEPLSYAFKEFHKMPLKFNPLALEAIKNGIPLVGEKLFTGLRSAFDEMKRRGLKKTKVTWTTTFMKNGSIFLPFAIPPLRFSP